MAKTINLESIQNKNEDLSTYSEQSAIETDGGRVYFGSMGKFVQELDSIKSCVQNIANQLEIDVEITDLSSSTVLKNTGKRLIKRDRTHIQVTIQKLEDSRKITTEILKEKCMGISEGSTINKLNGMIRDYVNQQGEKEVLERTKNMSPEELKEYHKELSRKSRTVAIGVRG